MSLRSKVVIESNLKPSQFGKPATAAAATGSVDNNTEDFEEVYENPLEKLKPLPPRVISGIPIMDQLRNDDNSSGNSNNVVNQELPRNETETMEFSNPSKNVNYNDREVNLSTEKIRTLDKPSQLINNKRNSNNPGIVNEGFDDPQSAGRQLDPNSINSLRHNDKLDVDVEILDPNRTTTNSMSNNGHNDRLPPPEDKPDISFRTVANIVRNIKSLDVNRYATKKTIAQGMLDIALLTANASQLKYILQIGRQHEFYILMLSLICVSIGLQLLHGVVCLLLGSRLNINKQQDHKKANVCNNICLILMMLTVAVNAVISAFDMRDTSPLSPLNATSRVAPIAQLPSGGR